MFDNALLLRRVAYGDADWVSTWLLQTHGKATLFAKSARRSKKRFPGGIEPFCLYSAALRLPRGDAMGKIYEADPEERWESIPLDMHKLAAASHLILTVNAVLEDSQGAGDFFAFFTRVLRWFEATDSNPPRIEMGLQRAQLRLLSAFGVLPSLTRAADTGRSLSELESAWLVPDVGICESRSGRDSLSNRLDSDDLEYLILLLAGRFPAVDHAGSRRNLRHAINNLVRFQFGKDLKTWKMYERTFDS